eukprot:SAG11_NODE_34784_length_270_cov_0.602339_2_plen_40_part_01
MQASLASTPWDEHGHFNRSNNVTRVALARRYRMCRPEVAR